jgi:predicted PurR-regulated permease PerM
MSVQNHVKTWIIMLIISIVLLWLFRGILLPFVTGLALAYLLDPLADKLEKWKFNRFMATLVVMVVMMILFLGALFLIVPLVISQVAGLAEKLPTYIAQLQALANQWMPEVYSYVGEERIVQLEEGMSSALGQGLGVAGNLASSIMQSGLAVLNAFGLLVVTPVVTFYMLLDWDRMVAAADKLLPRKNRDEIRSVLKDVDKAMSGVIRGQSSVVLILSVFYATSLSLTGLNFGLAIGLIAGLLSFIPYVGFSIGLVLSVGVALVQFWPDYLMVGIVFSIFMAGQFLEGNVLYPKLVGASIGIHPVWLMFALFACGLVFGFVGLLLAVPLVAIIGVLVRFATKKYKDSSLYLGEVKKITKRVSKK